MLKVIGLLAMMVLSMSAYSQECATNVSDLKELFGNRDFTTDWTEVDEHPFRMKFQDGKGSILIHLTSQKGEVAKVSAEVCKNGNNYVANIKNIVWGDGAPSAMKGRSVSSLKIKIPYQSVMKISVSLFSIEFHPTN